MTGNLREFSCRRSTKAVIHILNKNNLPYHLYNVGTGLDISINDLKLIKEIIGFKGEIKFDKSN